MTALSGGIFAVPPQRIKDTGVVAAIAGGNVAYQAEWTRKTARRAASPAGTGEAASRNTPRHGPRRTARGRFMMTGTVRKYVHGRLALLTTMFFLLFLAVCPLPARAMEGGTSHYIQGAYGDFLMGYIPAAGLYLRNDVLFQSAHLSGTIKGGRVYGDLDTRMYMNLTKLTYLTEVPAIGGLMGLGVGIPIIADLSVQGSMAADFLMGSHKTKQYREGHIQKAGGGDRGGLSDIILMPLIMAWNLGECHIVLSPLVFLPTGYFNPDVLTNLGMNYVTFDANAAFTWLSPKGYEVSFNAGYMMSTENEATQYQSGHEFHLDGTVAYHVNERLALGGVGYLYAQTTPDTGSGAKLGAYMSQAAGIGPAVTYTATLGNAQVTLFAKWLHDVHAKNRLSGDMIYGSFVLAF